MSGRGSRRRGAELAFVCVVERDGACAFFCNDAGTAEIYTLSLHDALPISPGAGPGGCDGPLDRPAGAAGRRAGVRRDRKSTRLNSSHSSISYAVFCLKKKRMLLAG